jgi:tyrosine-protein kinase Etk/Wzc
MQPDNTSGSTKQKSRDASEGSLPNRIDVLIKHRKLVGYIVGVTFILSIVTSLLLPNMYVATARVLPPQENNQGFSSLFASADDPLSGLAGSILGKTTPASLYIGIMKSRTVADALIRKFKLKELYDHNYIEDVYFTLEDRSTIEISKKDQLINVSVMDRDPKRAADLANGYVEMLDLINRKLNITEGKRKRLFLEGRLKEVRNDLKKAEMNLRSFQEKHQIVSIQEQAKVAIEGAAEIKGQLIAAQTELEVLKKFGTENQVEAVILNARIEELKKQLDYIEKGQNREMDSNNPAETVKRSNFYIPFEDLPHLGMQLMQLMREAKIQEKLFELLAAQYEMAQIEEAKDVDTIQVLDTAVPPEKKSSPRRSAIVISSVTISAMISFLLAFLLEYSYRDQSMQARWSVIMNRFSHKISRVRIKK